ncbi:MAG TPA: T9SS type A sorting domain-containing protein [Ignavibacteria bacterium]|nr:T9SS type A sorting domain-containing protein [Ignavibacteria bacterium]HMR39773.1 T9SS type A sorting domain-containing protein [Ignavibacteria bacterium]
MNDLIKILLIILSIIISSRSYSLEIPVYTGSEKTYMPVSAISGYFGKEDGILISWFEESNNGCIKIQKLDENGVVMWTENGVILETELGNEFLEETDYPFLFSDNKGGALMIYRKRYFEREDIMAKRILFNGSVEKDPVRISSGIPGFNFSPSAIKTYDDRIAVVWENFSGGDFNIEGQLLDLQGNKIWANGNPVQICNFRDEQRKPVVTCDENNKLLITWLDTRKHSEYVFDVYGRILDLYAPDFNYNPFGTLIFKNAITDNSRKLTMYDLNNAPIDKSSFLIVFENSYDNLFNDIRAIKIDNNLEKEWEIIIDSESDKIKPFIARIDNNRAGFFWNDIGDDHNEIYGIIAGKDGNILWGDKNGKKISYNESKEITEKVLPLSANRNNSLFKDDMLYQTWSVKDSKKLFVSSLHLSDGSIPFNSSEEIQEKISGGEFASISALKNNLMIVYKVSDYIYAASKDMNKQGITNNAEIPVLKNYPNPFNPATKIDFNIPADGFVRLSVFDISGRLVKELINGYQTKGDYQIGFNGSNLSSGVYLYKLEVAGKILVSKMTLLK